MYEVNARFSQPYSSICYVRCDWADGSSTRASAVIVGVNDVLTALHTVFDATRGGWARSVTIVPGADTSPYSQPFGAYTEVGSFNGRAANWDVDGDGLLTAYESQGDLALIGMMVPIGEQTGWLPVTQMATDLFGVMAGYPARGSGLMAESVLADARTDYSVYDINSSLGAGASGGPLLYTANGVTSVAGILSSGDAAMTQSTYAGLFSAATWNWLQAAIGANDGLLGSLPGSMPMAGGTLFTGTAFADVLNGTSSRDAFKGHGGNDVIEGHAGIDTSIYSGARGSYQVTVSDTIQVSDLMSGRDGSDTLHGIERLTFTDVSMAFDTAGSAGQAYRLYQAAFNRTPDLPGLGYQMKQLDDGLPLWYVAANFLRSPEFAGTYGALDDSQFVTQLYANVLHRAPDEGGFAYHTANLASGNFARSDVLVGFSESPENQAAVIGVIQGGMLYVV
jgi:V8-like Glu-specific endopeptidase